MKLTDQVDAKIALWARERRVVGFPRIVNLPPFTSRKFGSYEEFNAWKQGRILELARRGGAKWER